MERCLIASVEGAGEMAQQSRALAALAEDPGLSPSTHIVAHNSSSRGCPFRASVGTRLTNAAQTYIEETNLYTYKTDNFCGRQR